MCTHLTLGLLAIKIGHTKVKQLVYSYKAIKWLGWDENSDLIQIQTFVLYPTGQRRGMKHKVGLQEQQEFGQRQQELAFKQKLDGRCVRTNQTDLFQLTGMWGLPTREHDLWRTYGGLDQ